MSTNIMSNPHLNRWRSDALAVLNRYNVDQMPDVDIILLTVRSALIPRIVSNINDQVVQINKIIIMTQGYSSEQIKVLRDNIKNCKELIILSNDDTSVLLGERNNIIYQYTSSDYVAIMDDDDIYYPNYLKSQLSYVLDHGKPSAISKINPIGRNESTNKIGFVLRKIRLSETAIGAGGSIVFHRELYEAVGGFKNIQVGYDSHFMIDSLKRGYKIIAADPFNFIVTRGRPEGNTWKMDRLSGIDLNNIKLNEIKL